MIILDTNVASEIIRDRADPAVIAWVDSLTAEDVAITAITAAEMRLGIELMPKGNRRASTAARVEQLVEDAFAGRVWPFDVGCTSHYAATRSERKRLGRPISIADAQIAAIALHHGALLATRNVKDFEGTGVEVLNPWLD